jgi:hypothetical protein
MTKLHRHEVGNNGWMPYRQNEGMRYGTGVAVKNGPWDSRVLITDDGNNSPHRSDPWTPEAHTVYKHWCKARHWRYIS